MELLISCGKIAVTDHFRLAGTCESGKKSSGAMMMNKAAAIHQPAPVAPLDGAAISTRPLKNLVCRSSSPAGKSSMIIPIRAIRVPISFQYQIWLDGGSVLPPCRVCWNQPIASPMAVVEIWSPGWVVVGWYQMRAVPSAIEPYNLLGTTSLVVPKTVCSF